MHHGMAHSGSAASGTDGSPSAGMAGERLPGHSGHQRRGPRANARLSGRRPAASTRVFQRPVARVLVRSEPSVVHTACSSGRLRRHLDRWGTTVCSEFRGGAGGTTRRWRPRAADCLPAVRWRRPSRVHRRIRGCVRATAPNRLPVSHSTGTEPAAVGGYCRPTDTHRRHPLGCGCVGRHRSSSSGGAPVSDALPVGGSGGARFRIAGRPRVGEEMARRVVVTSAIAVRAIWADVCRAGIPSRFGLDDLVYGAIIRADQHR